jgi:hypothetical protein
MHDLIGRDSSSNWESTPLQWGWYANTGSITRLLVIELTTSLLHSKPWSLSSEHAQAGNKKNFLQ